MAQVDFVPFALVFATAFLLAATGTVGPAGDLPDLAGCPIRFAEMPLRVSSPDLAFDIFTGSRPETIQVLAPRSRGFSVLAVAADDPNPLYGRYRTDEQLDTRDLELGRGTRGLDWSTAAVAESDLVSEVRPGRFRLVLQYLSIEEAHRKGDRFTTVCVAISPSFELTSSFFVHRFE